MPEEGLHEVTQDHYKRAIPFLAEYIVGKCSEKKGEQFNTIDVGCGAKSVLMSAVEQICLELRGEVSENRPKSLEKACRDLKNSGGGANNLKLWLLDKEKPDQVSGACGSVYQTAESEFDCFGSRLKAEFIEKDFGDFIAKEGEIKDFFGKTKFDLIVFHFVNHHIFDQTKKKTEDEKKSACDENKEPTRLEERRIYKEIKRKSAEYVSGKEYVEALFDRFSQMLAPGGSVLISDIYYPIYLTAKECYETIESLSKDYKTGGDVPAIFSFPERILEAALGEYPGKFEVVYDDTMLVTFESKKDKNKKHRRKSYLTVLQKK